MHFGDEDFNFDFDLGDFEVLDINFDNFKIEIPDFEMPEIPNPEVPLDLNKIWEEIDKHDFDNGNMEIYAAPVNINKLKESTASIKRTTL